MFKIASFLVPLTLLFLGYTGHTEPHYRTITHDNIGFVWYWSSILLSIMRKKTTVYISRATLQQKNRIRDIFHTKQVHQALNSILQEKLLAHTIE